MSIVTIQPVQMSHDLKKDVLEIMAAHADQKTIRVALKAYATAMAGGISFSNCSFSGVADEAVDVDKDKTDEMLDTLPKSDV